MTISKDTEIDVGRYAYAELDRLIHERARLSVMSSLAANPRGLSFTELKKLCGLTDGNLSRHISMLQTAKLVSSVKSFEQNRPQTWCKLTAEGRQRYLQYLTVLEQIVRDASQKGRSAKRPSANSSA